MWNQNDRVALDCAPLAGVDEPALVAAAGGDADYDDDLVARTAVAAPVVGIALAGTPPAAAADLGVRRIYGMIEPAVGV